MGSKLWGIWLRVQRNSRIPSGLTGVLGFVVLSYCLGVTSWSMG